MQRIPVLPFLLACIVVGAALWALDHYAARLSQPLFPRDAARTRREPAPTGNEPANNSPGEPSTAIPDSPTARRASIEKCIKNGQVLYSDADCAGRADARTVTLHDTAGIVSPNQALLSQLEAQRHARERERGDAPNMVAIVGADRTQECPDLSRQIDDYDALARQPHSAYMQDWIRQQRKAARDRQFALRCR